MRALLFAFALTLSACIFFVGKDEYSDTCKFEGSDSTCGTCITKSCKTELNACCSSFTCELIQMKELDACAPRSSCSTFRTTTTPIGEDDRLENCVATSCKTQCGIP